MKYQFQFAGANVSRRSTSQKSRLRIAILAAALVLAGLAYANYIFNIFHVPFMPFHRATAVTAAKAVAAAPATTAATAKVITATAAPATKEPVTTAVKDTTEATTVAVANTIAQPVTAAPATTVAPVTPVTTTASAAPVATPTTPEVAATAVPTAPATTVPIAAPVSKPEVVSVTTTPLSQIVSTPLPSTIANQPKPKVHTPQERLMIAGQAAFAMTMDLATKYPDAYGFRAEDVFADAKLGDPMPIYTVEETDRAKYHHGESVKPILKEAKQWAFPVTVNNRVACMVTVSYSHHDYVPGKGSKILGMAWDKITEKWPADEGYHPCIVMNPDVPGYYFTVPELPEQNMTDIVRLFDFHMNLSPADVILASWR